MKKRPLPIGISDFTKMISRGFYYIDKSDFIREIIDTSAEVILVPRPRRFGKTLNLNMLKVFFETGKAGNRKLFRGLSIEKDECFGLHQGKYPVIFLTMKDLKHPNWEECFLNLKNVVYDAFAAHRYLLEGDTLYPEEEKRFQEIIDSAADKITYENSLKFLSRLLSRYHGEPVVILVDEYDTPLHSGFSGGYYEKIIGFMRNFLSGGLKDNPHLFKGVLTGILRVAKESIFSGLNNLGVYTLLDNKFSDAFGFTETEVSGMLETSGMVDDYDKVSSWYNGYRFGNTVIYNPWSVINMIDHGTEKAYWVNTADTFIIDRLITWGGREIREEIGLLLEGGTIERPVYENIVMRDLEVRDDMVWSFLLFSGYLKFERKAMVQNVYPLAIPNTEVRIAFEELVIRWFSEKVESNCLMEMLAALEKGKMAEFGRLLQKIVMQVMSYHDLGNEPEKVYHALVLGMLVWMSGKYDIRSNRESGLGRYDLMLKPKDRRRTGIIIEFKLVESKADGAEDAVLEDALKQIQDKEYAAELKAWGVAGILEIAVAFRGKELWVRHVRETGG